MELRQECSGGDRNGARKPQTSALFLCTSPHSRSHRPRWPTVTCEHHSLWLCGVTRRRCAFTANSRGLWPGGPFVNSWLFCSSEKKGEGENGFRVYVGDSCKWLARLLPSAFPRKPPLTSRVIAIIPRSSSEPDPKSCPCMP